MGLFSSLHHHTTYSYLDGYGTPEQHARAAADLGMGAYAATEHGNVTSHVRHEQACKEVGIKPIFGVELYTGAVDEATRSRFKWHLTVLAENQVGYANLLRLVSRGWSPDHFYYEPTVSGEDLVEFSEGLVVLSGCSGSKMACDLLGGKGEELHAAELGGARATAERFKALLGDRFYLEAQAFPELERTKAINQNWQRLSEQTGIPLVVTGDVHYPKAEDNTMQTILHAVDRGGANNTYEKQARSWGYDIKLTTFTDKKILKRLQATGLTGSQAEAALQTTADIAGRCNVTIPKLKDLTYPGATPSKELFRTWLNAGWKYRKFDKLAKAERVRYKNQIKYEAELIEMKGFVDYFLVISEAVRWAKNNGIAVGPARGSAAASLVCYALRITEVNPMLFRNLLFERFIDINRHDLPDIDLDFDDERRHEVRQHLVDLYGEDRVGNIGTFTKYKGKNSLIDIARVMSVPIGAVEKVKSMMLERSSGDLRASNTVEDTIAMFPQVKAVFDQYPALYLAQRLEGNLRGFSVHAAGLVVANEPLTNSVAVYSRKDKVTGKIGNVLSIDKYDAEYVGALKIDALGLTTMTVIRRVLDKVGMSLQELYDVPLDLEWVFEGFRRQELTGIFQFDGRAMRSVCKEVKPDNFAEVCDINALARPGPLHSGAAAEYVMVKHKKKKREKLDGRVEEITKDTNGQIVYQEQILQVVRIIGNFSWEEAANIRKLISKKQGEQAFSRMEELFLKGAKKNGVPEGQALRIWKQLVTAGAYAFNAAHCVSYGMLAYWTMWLKQKYPLEFYWAALISYDPKTKGFDLLQEAVARGFEILPPHPHRSQRTWEVEEGGLRAGFEQVNGIGEKTADAMVQFRQAALAIEDRAAYAEEFAWQNYIAVSGIGPATMKKVEEFTEQRDPFGLYTLGENLGKVRRWLWQHSDETEIPFPEHKADDVPYEAKRGTYYVLVKVVQRNLKDIYELHMSRTGVELDPKKVKEPQYVNYMALLGKDETGLVNVTIHRFGGLWERYKNAVMEMNVERDLLLVEGYKRLEYRRAIYAKRVWVVNPDKLEG
jgi:DNA polymerase-3 subunit alpha